MNKISKSRRWKSQKMGKNFSQTEVHTTFFCLGPWVQVLPGFPGLRLTSGPRPSETGVGGDCHAHFARRSRSPGLLMSFVVSSCCPSENRAMVWGSFGRSYSSFGAGPKGPLFAPVESMQRELYPNVCVR